MTFPQIKAAILCSTLGIVLATSGYMLSTASYVGSSTDITLIPTNTDSGTMWTAENEQIAVEVRYITSVINTPKITIRKKQQWIPLAIAMSAGMLFAYIMYRWLMRKSRQSQIEAIPPQTPSTTPTTPNL